MIYEIINPLERYTLESEDPAVAAVTTLILGAGNYGLKRLTEEESGEWTMPIFAYGDHEEWLKQNLDIELIPFLDSHLSEIADCMGSVVIGDRKAYDLAISILDPDACSAFKAAWQEKYRPSMNDIGSYAAAWAKWLREKGTAPILDTETD